MQSIVFPEKKVAFHVIYVFKEMLTLSLGCVTYKQN